MPRREERAVAAVRRFIGRVRRVPTEMPEEQLFLLLAIIVGVLSGLSVVCFQVSIRWIRILLLGSSLRPGWPRVVLAPTVFGLIVAVLVLKVFPRVRGSGVNQTKAAVYIYDGFIPFSTVIGKFITCSLGIGSGQSLGPEDPSLQIGAGLASAIGRKLRLSRERVRLIAPIGAAAGLAAAFNAPVTAVLFVVEEVIGQWSAGVLGAIVLAAVASAVVEHWFMGAEPLFRIPQLGVIRPIELLGYAMLGIVSGIASVVISRVIQVVRPRMKALPHWTQYLQPALAGLFIGVVGLRFPQVMGAGYEYMENAMHGQYTWQVLGILAGLKIITTSASFVTGTPGGMFAPTLFIGAMLGAAVGGVEHAFFPQLAGSTGAYALIGMGTLFAGFLRAPMTSVFMILEVSGDYSVILPVMVSNTIAYLIARTLQHTPIFEFLTEQDGLHLPSMEEQREHRSLRVEDAMRPTLAPPMHLSDSLETVQNVANASVEESLLASDGSRWYVFSRADLHGWLVKSAADGAGTLRDYLKRSVPVLYPDYSLDAALEQLGTSAILPVVHRANRSLLIGVLSAADVLAAYRRTDKVEQL
jgi:chloride channel protein, CIC family